MEIGSVLELDDWDMYEYTEEKRQFHLPFMYDNKYYTIFFQSGRNAIESLMKYLIKELGIEKILLPDYVCETVVDAVVRANMDYENYSINREFEGDLAYIEKKINEGIKCVYIVQYFGKRISNKMLSAINSWKVRGILVIEDVTMSLFSCNKTAVGFGDYIIGSIRKWLPIPDGGFISTRGNMLPDEPEKNCISKYTYYYSLVQIIKREYINGNLLDKKLKEEYMEYYKKSIDELFSDYNIYPISQMSMSYLKKYNIKEVIEKRIKNYDYLYKKLDDISCVKLKVEREKGFVPFGIVIESTNRDELLNYLIKHNIYCNVHWRLVDKTQNNDSNYLSHNLITIPCDQRYSDKEMDYIATVIRKYEKKVNDRVQIRC